MDLALAEPLGLVVVAVVVVAYEDRVDPRVIDLYSLAPLRGNYPPGLAPTIPMKSA
jgi:hypothetical protein